MATSQSRALALLEEVEHNVDTLVTRIVERVRAFDAPDGYAAVPAEEIAATTSVLSHATLRALRDAEDLTGVWWALTASADVG